MILMRYFSGVVVWSFILFGLGSLIAFTAAMFYHYHEYDSIHATMKSDAHTANIDYRDALDKIKFDSFSKDDYLHTTIVSGAVTAIYLFALCFLYSRISLAIAIIKTAT